MSIVPCVRGEEYAAKVREIADLLKSQAHTIAGHGLGEDEFYDAGYFRAAIEIVRGEFAATLREKRAFLRGVFGHMKDHNLINDWEHAESQDRHDYRVDLIGGGTAVIEQKGCLDGNNVNISERPPQATEFYIWSICTNPGSDIGKGVASAVMRITAEMLATGKKVDGLIVWDMMCGATERPCPKLAANPQTFCEIGAYHLPPPCVYLFPDTIGHARLNQTPARRALDSCRFAVALLAAFGGSETDVNFVEYDVRTTPRGRTQRLVRVIRDSTLQHETTWATVRRVLGS